MNEKDLRFLFEENGAACSCRDIVNGLTVSWLRYDFNGTQKFSWDNLTPVNVSILAKAMGEMTDWLIENHREVL